MNVCTLHRLNRFWDRFYSKAEILKWAKQQGSTSRASFAADLTAAGIDAADVQESPEQRAARIVALKDEPLLIPNWDAAWAYHARNTYFIPMLIEDRGNEETAALSLGLRESLVNRYHAIKRAFARIPRARQTNFYDVAFLDVDRLRADQTLLALNDATSSTWDKYYKETLSGTPEHYQTSVDSRTELRAMAWKAIRAAEHATEALMVVAATAAPKSAGHTIPNARSRHII